MLARIRVHMSYANIAATLALFLALAGGIAWALERNSVKSRHIAPDAVKGADAKESTFAQVPEALDSGEVLYGITRPLSASEVFFTVPELNLRVEADPDNTSDDEVVLENLGTSGDLTVQLPNGTNTVTPGTEVTFTAPIGGGTQQVELMVHRANATANEDPRLLLHCYFYAGTPNDCLGFRLNP